MSSLPGIRGLKEKRLAIPLTDAVIRELKVGDLVYLDGRIFTTMTKWHVRTIDQGIKPPFDIRNACNVMMHAGPAVRRVGDDYQISSLSPLVSMMFAKWTPAVLGQLGVKAIIGKAGMQKWVCEEGFRKYGAVYLLSVGTWIGAWYASRVKRVREVFWLELGLPEATWVLDVEGFGPFLVETDSRGESFYESTNQRINRGSLRQLRGMTPYQFVMKRVGEVGPTDDIW